ncbi:MAG TPA: DNA ligase D [Chitinispirillaceae bacterium]|nr:DNA ligase D [Chitinispirillaceae bacterium]
MSLENYYNKRNLHQSNEPYHSDKTSLNNDLLFVIHKHHSSHLHFDLRLELDGVLKSWAVPKGISLDPSEKRLAVMVEDHPLEYRNFEGVIPQGNYGAGTVMIWDEGTYSVPGTSNKNEASEELHKGLTNGHAAFFLHGEKLQGEFLLVKMHGTGHENNWLLFKKSDTFSYPNTIIDQRSIRTGRTMDEISIGISEPELPNHPAPSENPVRKEEIAFRPSQIKPMLSYQVDNPFDRTGWIFEIKWDGYRTIAELRHHEILLYSRNGKTLNNSFPQIVNDLRSFSFDGILDGELVVVDASGKADFEALQNYGRTQQGNIRYYVFDILEINGIDLHHVPLIKRKEILKNTLPPHSRIRYNEHIEESGDDFFRIVKEQHIEGMMAKDGNSPYIEGKRTRYWLKIKTTREHDFVIGGFTEPKGGRYGFGALLVGTYRNNMLLYAGHVGGGLSESELQDIFHRLQPLIVPQSPFAMMPRSDSGITWVKPELVCQVQFAEWTSDGILRQPVFMRLRDDIDPYSVVREDVEEPNDRPLQLSNPPSNETTVLINNRTLRLTNTNKVFWPDEHITKCMLIDFYRQISSIILPHLRDRPQSLHRFPDGINGEHFFHKDIRETPDWIETISIDSESQSKMIRYILCQDEASLIYIINLGAIELNVWNSRLPHLDSPDYAVIDLDPNDCPFDYVIKAAQTVHSVLNEAKILHYIKTSGATGLHIFIPLNQGYSHQQARQFSEIICIIVHKLLPNITSLERTPQKRVGKVYLDFLQNVEGKTMAAPYCVRPRPFAPVSTPLFWEELYNQITPEQFTITSILPRLEYYGDLWKPMIGKGIAIENFLPVLKALYEGL